MTQIIISDLETNLELDRQALASILGGKKGKWFGPRRRKHHRGGYGSKYYFVEYYKESYKFDYYDSHCYTPKFKHFGCYC